MESIILFEILLGASLAFFLLRTNVASPLVKRDTARSLGDTCNSSNCTSDHKGTVKVGLNGFLNITIDKYFHGESNTVISLQSHVLQDRCRNISASSNIWIQFCNDHDTVQSTSDTRRRRLLGESSCYLEKWITSCYRNETNDEPAINLLGLCQGCPSPNETCNGYFHVNEDSACETTYEGSLYQALLVSYAEQLHHFTGYRNRD